MGLEVGSSLLFAPGSLSSKDVCLGDFSPLSRPESKELSRVSPGLGGFSVSGKEASFCSTPLLVLTFCRTTDCPLPFSLSKMLNLETPR